MLFCFVLRARARQRPLIALGALALALVALRAPARADHAADSPADSSGAGGAELCAPTLGRPAFVEPGGTFQLAARIPQSGGTVALDLVRSEPSEQRYRLQCEPGALSKLTAGQPLLVTVPREVPPQTYDLEVGYDGTQLLSRHCVSVGHVDRVLRIVHLSNMNVGDIGAPHFDQRLIDEVNLVAPTLIVASGDLLDATHPDPATGWRELREHLIRFEAPVVMACGDHDDIEMYSRHVASSPIGLISVGRHRCLVLFDQPRAPVQNDLEQIRWAQGALGRPGFDGLTFVLSHDEEPNLLRHWQQQGILTRMIRAGRIGLWFAGGHRDWDGCASRELIDAAKPMVYVQTHQSSPAPCEGAAGTSHYRIVDIVDDRVVLPHGTPQSSGIPPSTPVGHLRANFEGANDGSQSGLGFVVTNNLPYRLNGLALRLRLRKVSGQTPWCHGARLEQVIDLGMIWECRVRFDLPDKGGLRARAGSGPEPPLGAVHARFAADSTLCFRRQVAPQGLAYLSLTNDPPVVHVENNGDKVVVVSPLARLDGNAVAYRPLRGQARFATAYRLRLQPGETISLQLDLSAARVAPGRRELQVYLEDAGVAVPFCYPVDVVVDG